jgi:ribosome-associated heat shock protein Hsp15
MESQRLDKWLWSARFFKTRALAVEAVNGGKVHVNRTRVKPSRTVQIGDRLAITRGEYVYDIEILGLSARRGPAKQAQLLYEESAESMAARQSLAEERRLQRASQPAPQRRPDKRSRRKIIRFTRKQGNE